MAWNSPKKGMLISKEAPRDLFKKLTTGSGLTIEVWIEPYATQQYGPARIISYSIDPYARNFTLGQSGDGLILRLRTSRSDLNGVDQQLKLENVLKAKKIQHIAATYDFEQRCLYVDGHAALCSDRLKGDFSNWDSAHQLIIGNEASGNRPWLGKIFYAAIYERALNKGEIRKHFNSGYKNRSGPAQSSGQSDSGPVVTYMFGEKAGNTVYDQSKNSSHINLYMPQKMPRGKRGIINLSSKINLEDILSIDNILTNVLAFLPFGFLLCFNLKTFGYTIGRLALFVMIVALSVSFGFEYLHSYLPGRHASAVEVFLKVLGIFSGMTLCLGFSDVKKRMNTQQK